MAITSRNPKDLMKTFYKVLLAVAMSVAGALPAFGWWSDKPPPNPVLPTSAKRNNVFYVGEDVSFTVAAPVRYEVRNYYGQVVDEGSSTARSGPRPLTVKAKQPGWYKLYLYGSQDQGEPWGKSVGSTTFVIFRKDARFPSLPASNAPGAPNPYDDEQMRGVTGMGPQRLKADASNPAQTIADLDVEVAIDKAMYLPFDSKRKRVLLIAFPNGTSNLDGVRQIVEHFKNDVQYWEARNEPNFSGGGADFVNKELKPFYQTIKGVSAKLKVIGPGLVTMGPSQGAWMQDFFAAGGAKCIDAFSFHAYNNVNGDFWLTRASLNHVRDFLAKAGIPNIELWQTEQGYAAANFGAFVPRLQGRWTMLQMMMYEQYGIPKEHNHLWYDKSHGFWDVPHWWENDDGSLNPAASLMRVWSEEIYGMNFQKAYDFGSVANDLYLGNLFSDGTKSVAAFMSAGNPQGSVQLNISPGSSVHVVSPFGEESDLPVTNGIVNLPVNELPTYVHLAAGQQCQVIQPIYGYNMARQSGVTVTANGSARHPFYPNIPNQPAKLVNGKLENWYWSTAPADRPWMSNVPDGPITVEIGLPQEEKISDIIIHAAVPWQEDGTLLDYDLQYWNGTDWTAIAHVTEPPNTFRFYSAPTHTTVDSFFSDRYTFEHHFDPVTTNKIRLVVNKATAGGGATLDLAVAQRPWNSNVKSCQATLREIAIYKAPTNK